MDIDSFGASEDDVILKVWDCDTKDGKGECEVEGEAEVVRTNFCVAADGSGRSVAEKMSEETKTKVVSYVDDNVRIYKTIPLKLPKKDWRYDLNYSARTGDGRFNLDALPATPEGDYCAVMLLKETDPLAKENADPLEMRSDFDKILPQFSALISDEVMERVAKKPVSRLPSFRYVAPKLHCGKVVLLGDCAHTVKVSNGTRREATSGTREGRELFDDVLFNRLTKTARLFAPRPNQPYFGLGANSALEDVATLGSIMEGDKGYTDVAEEFTKKRGLEAKALVKLSRGFDRPGKLGFATFILPLILDGIFHGMLPAIFAPNTIAMLQASKSNKDGKAIQFSFNEVIWRKRADRIGQIGILSTVFASFALGLTKAVATAAKISGRRRINVVVGTGAVLGLTSIVRKVYANLKDNSAGELLVKTGQDINGKGGTGGLKAMDNESFLMNARGKQRERDGG